MVETGDGHTHVTHRVKMMQQWFYSIYSSYLFQLCACNSWINHAMHTVYPKKYAHGFVVLCFVVVMQSFIMNSHEVFIHIHQGCFAGTGAIVRLPQCQWSKPDGYGKISQCITTTKHSKAKTVCIFLGIYCTIRPQSQNWRLGIKRHSMLTVQHSLWTSNAVCSDVLGCLMLSIVIFTTSWYHSFLDVTL